MKHVKYLLAALLLIMSAIYFFVQKGHISINSEHAKLYLLKGGYRSWTMQYSHGHQLQPEGTVKNLWKWPTFHHADIRTLFEHGIIKRLEK